MGVFMGTTGRDTLMGGKGVFTMFEDRLAETA